MFERFRGKTVLVTGGNSGIGLATAKAFAREGARLVIIGRDPHTLREAAAALGEDTIAISADLGDVSSIEQAVATLKKQVDHIDIAYINAGIAAFVTMDQLEEATWDRVFNTNLKGAFFTVKNIRHLMTSGGSIIFCGSPAGHVARPGMAAYGGSKAGLSYLTKQIASELVDDGIRVNMMIPGVIETSIARRTEGVPPEQADHVLNSLIAITPLKRAGLPEEAAAAVLFLASDEAAFITGNTLMVDGGTINIG